MATPTAPTRPSYRSARNGWTAGTRRSSSRSCRSSTRITTSGTARAGATCSTTLLADLASGHNVVATVFVECRSMYRADGPEALRPVGETEFVNGVAAMSASGIYGPTRVCAGIVGHADLRLGAAVQEVLEAHIRAGGDRFRGIRHIAAWDADPSILNPEQPGAARAPGGQGVPRRLRGAWPRSASRSTPGSTILRSPS